MLYGPSAPGTTTRSCRRLHADPASRARSRGEIQPILDRRRAIERAGRVAVPLDLLPHDREPQHRGRVLGSPQNTLGRPPQRPVVRRTPASGPSGRRSASPCSPSTQHNLVPAGAAHPARRPRAPELTGYRWCGTPRSLTAPTARYQRRTETQSSSPGGFRSGVGGPLPTRRWHTRPPMPLELTGPSAKVGRAVGHPRHSRLGLPSLPIDQAIPWTPSSTRGPRPT